MSRTNAISTQSRTFLFTQMRVVPVTGRDSMLLNPSGVHGPYFIRNIVIPAESAGNTSLGEVAAGAALRKTPEDSSQRVAGQLTGNDLCDVHPGGCRDARQDTAIVTYGIWQGGQRPTKASLQIVGGMVDVPTAAGGALRSIWRRSRLRSRFSCKGLGTRDDAIAMQYVTPGWKFDNKRPSPVR
jgi:hypothetical protein